MIPISATIPISISLIEKVESKVQILMSAAATKNHNIILVLNFLVNPNQFLLLNKIHE